MLAGQQLYCCFLAITGDVCYTAKHLLRHVSSIRSSPAGLWSLDSPSDPSTAAVIQDAIQKPDRYVLKPQREGGGNNLYGDELVKALQEGLAAGGEGLAAYILMQRIVPPPQRTVFVRNGDWMEEESLSELGIYGTYLRVDDKVGLICLDCAVGAWGFDDPQT